MKKNKKTRRIIEISLLLIITFSVIALSTSAVQTFLAKFAAEKFSETLGTEVKVGKVHIKHLTHIEIDDVLLRDQQGENMVSFDELDVRIKFLPLFNGELSFRDIMIDGLNANLYVKEDSTMNLQFLVDAFPYDSTMKTPDIKIGSAKLTNANVRYRDWRTNTDLDVRNFNTEISFSLKDESNVECAIKSMRFAMKDEQVLKNLQAKAVINDETMGVSDVKIEMRNSKVQLDEARIGFKYNNKHKVNWGACTYAVKISPSTFTPQDISWLVPELRLMNKPVNFELVASGTIDDIKTDKIHIDYDEDILLNASIESHNITDIGKMQASLNIQDLRFSMSAINTLAQQITGHGLGLPGSLNNLGVCCYRGTVSGSIDDVKLDGKLNTAQGYVSTNVELHTQDTLKTFDIKGKISTSTIDVGKLISDPELGLGPTEVGINVIAHIGKGGKFDITVDGDINKATFKNYTYNNLMADCTVSDHAFHGKVKLDDPNGRIDLSGHVLFDKKKEFVLEADIDSLKLGKMNLVKEMPDFSVSLRLNSDMNFYDLNTINGDVKIEDILIKNGEESYKLNHLNVTAQNDKDTNYIEVRSDLINGEVYGHYKADDIYPNLINTLSNNLPRIKTFCNKKPTGPTDITASFDIEPVEELMTTLGIPWYTTETSTLHATYKSDRNRFSSYFIIPQVSNGSMTIDSTILNINNREKVNVNLRTSTDLPIGHINGKVGVNVDHGVIETSVIWKDEYEDSVQFGGEIYAKTSFDVSAKEVRPKIEIMPTQFLLHGIPWQFGHSFINFGEEKIEIDNFVLASEDGQSIATDGVISDKPNDTLAINIKDLMLEYVTEMLPEETSAAIAFGGKFTANGYATELMSSNPHINLKAEASPFAFNHTELGSMKADVKFDTEHSNLAFYATIFDTTSTKAVLDGHFHFGRDSLDIKGHAEGLNLSIIDKYIGEVLGTLQGEGYGDVHIHSVGKDIAIEGDVLAKDASLGVNFLNTRFYLSDTIKIRHNIIEFNNIALSDKHGGKGKLNGAIKHRFFQDMNFNLMIHLDTMLTMNTTRNESPSFYGKVLATGNIAINGNDKLINITGKAKTEPHTLIVLPIDNYSATENSFLTFVKPVTKAKETEKKRKPQNAGNLLVNLMLDISPQTDVSLITNSKTGDKLDARVTGNLRLTFDVNNSDIKLYGDLDVISGLYIFTLQEIIRKEFKFKNGGTIKWAGDPMSANLNIEGYYQLNANVKDLLDEASLINFDRTTVPVQCILKITGKLTQPEINFDIALPNSDDELKRLVQAAINTPEKMYREVVALLLLGKFIKAESMNNSSFISQNELYSAVSTTISAQINNWASQMFDHWGFGVNIRKADNDNASSTDMEYEFNFQYTPTDRILINGNVGYREGTSTNTNFIGDFDFEYKLTESGEFRIKAYTHTNDYKEFKKGATTQGVGLLWTESFKDAKDLRETIKAQAEKGKRDRALRKKEREEKKKKREAEKAAAMAAKEAKKTSEASAVSTTEENEKQQESQSKE